MNLTKDGKVRISGLAYDNPLDTEYPKRAYAEGKESARISFRSIWLDRYGRGEDGHVKSYSSEELKLLSNGKVFLDGRELKDESSIETAKEIFKFLKVS